MRFRIASKVWEIRYEDRDVERWLRPELAQYPSATDEPDVHLTIGKLRDLQILSQNPKTVLVEADSITFRFGYIDVTWRGIHDSVHVHMAVSSNRLDWRRKLLGWQYTHPIEDIGQFFHELVLVPTFLLFFSDEIAVIHASASETAKGQGILLAGTGGVGKTSLALELGRTHGSRFLADDISFVSQLGVIWPNFSYPKIYGYNLQNDPELAANLLGSRSVPDRMAWHLRRWLWSPSQVRRRVDPASLYSSGLGSPTKLDRVVFLFRQNVDSLSMESLAPSIAAEMASTILAAEYSSALFDPLALYSYNQKVVETIELPTKEQVLAQTRAVLRGVLSQANVQLLKIPLHLTARELRSLAPALLAD